MRAADSATYSDVKVYTGLSDATPHQVVQQMLETMLTRVAQAKGQMERGDVQAKSETISKALAITEALVLSLDRERGGAIAGNLEQLYDYISRTLLAANLENRVELLAEAAELITEIKSGWDAIGEAGPA